MRVCPGKVIVLLLLMRIAVSWTIASAAEPASPVFEVSRAPGLHGDAPISARVYVMLGRPTSGDRPAKPKTGPREPRFGPNWFDPQPMFAVDVKDWRPGTTIKIGADAAAFPGPIASLKPGAYPAQAVVRLNPDTHALGNGEGNAYGPETPLEIDPKKGGVLSLTVDQLVPERPFHETERVKLVTIDSPLLSAFHHRTIKHRAAVILPEGDLKEKRATLYIIPGFGGDHHLAERFLREPRLAFGKDLIRVILNPDCGTGHHVFADSATNGPRGRALIEELIPHIEKTFPAIAEPRARLLNGHSSGGWSSLWLQVTYPDTFGGVWSTAPDPVDFRDFQQVDLYAASANLFFDERGEPRPVIRMGKRPLIFFKNFSPLEDVIGDGGQLHSFEAVFSPLGPDGHPRPLWDRKTGAVDPVTAKAWEKYDIRLVLETNWGNIGPKLKGKIRVIAAEMDNFYLAGAVRLLKESLQKLGDDAQVEVVDGKDHMTLMDAKLAARIDREIREVLGIEGDGSPQRHEDTKKN